MSDLCASCGAEPRHGSSPFGERCLWPVRQAEIEAAAREPVVEVHGPEEWLVDGTGKPFASLHQPQDATTGVSAIFGALPDEEVDVELSVRRLPSTPIEVTAEQLAAPLGLLQAMLAEIDQRHADDVELTLEPEPYPRDPRGQLDAGATVRPEPPCCARVGSWWCYLPAGHKELCKGPGEREIKGGGIDKGRIQLSP